jgi:succinate dehydrogenase/fumarate reductase-like Fe-S protein
MPKLVQKLKGNSYLVYRALIHLLKQPFAGDGRGGKARFLANYAPEGNLPTSTEDRAVLRGASRCIHCGLCEAYDLALAAQPRSVYEGASALPVSYARAVPDLRHARKALERLDEGQLAGAEAICPTRVPLREIARYLKRKLAELDREIERAAQERSS